MEDSSAWDSSEVDASLEHAPSNDHESETVETVTEAVREEVSEQPDDAPFDTPFEVAHEELPDEPEGVDAAVADATSETFLGKWTELVSSTNWEKGRIIYEWREALIASGAAPRQYSDEVWSQRVSSVSGQHVGRLRRVFERFGEVRRDYKGLYWSHFQAALDWTDAEMWLEGAVQSNWSISMMREHRATTLGGEPSEITISGELDEDFSPVRDNTASLASEPAADTHRESNATEFDGDYSRESEGSDFGNEPGSERTGTAQADGSEESEGLLNTEGVMNAPMPVRPFAALPQLPDDLHDAFESFKLAILRHKLAEWKEVPCDDVLASLDGLKQLALAPA